MSKKFFKEDEVLEAVFQGLEELEHLTSSNEILKCIGKATLGVLYYTQQTQKLLRIIVEEGAEQQERYAKENYDLAVLQEDIKKQLSIEEIKAIQEEIAAAFGQGEQYDDGDLYADSKQRVVQVFDASQLEKVVDKTKEKLKLLDELDEKSTKH